MSRLRNGFLSLSIRQRKARLHVSNDVRVMPFPLMGGRRDDDSPNRDSESATASASP